MTYFTAEHITRIIFDAIIPPNALDKAAAFIFNRPATNRPIPLNAALKQLANQKMQPATLRIVEKTLHNLMTERLHDFLANHAFEQAVQSNAPTMAHVVVHNIRWSNNYYLGAGIVSPRIRLDSMPNIVKNLRADFKDELHSQITQKFFLFRTSQNTPKIGGGPGQHG